MYAGPTSACLEEGLGPWDENGNHYLPITNKRLSRGEGHCEETELAKLRTKAFRPKVIDPLRC